MLRSITRLGIALLNFSQALLALLGNHVDGAQLLSVLILFWLFVIHVLSKFPDAVSVNVSKQQFRCRAHTRTAQAHPLQRRKNGWSSVRGEWPPCCATYDRPSEGVGVLAVLRKPKIEKFKSMYTPKNLFAERLRGALYSYCPRARREHNQSKYSRWVAMCVGRTGTCAADDHDGRHPDQLSLLCPRGDCPTCVKNRLES